MRDQPTGDQLLETARELLREQVLPILPANQCHAALMIANAMAIAMRELKSGYAHEREEFSSLVELLQMPEEVQSLSGLSLTGALGDGNRSLCQMIRSGGADSGIARDAVGKHLLLVTRNRVSISNPKYLL
ncbi:DUF6285 domain-containing protein [Paraburkholderia sp. BL10I2N1]|uniref:DUF6285 domain-containing protein n=1 Tax=Paraburkholderia sp. BL10I2N1 TaxID=1938796 RepID=UPI00105F2D25|nr:DUF6285 domain-containing protein [Paraburkholderia sp. BL10I2N1]TDN61928.1 hypothetical protein B0G77_5438 [Paraburkholderia sp. BL10I2N1]